MIAPECFTCHVPVPDEPGVYYCDACVAVQMTEQGDERAAFDAYHRFADDCSKRSL